MRLSWTFTELGLAAALQYLNSVPSLHNIVVTVWAASRLHASLIVSSLFIMTCLSSHLQVTIRKFQTALLSDFSSVCKTGRTAVFRQIHKITTENPSTLLLFFSIPFKNIFWKASKLHNAWKWWNTFREWLKVGGTVAKRVGGLTSMVLKWVDVLRFWQWGIEHHTKVRMKMVGWGDITKHSHSRVDANMIKVCAHRRWMFKRLMNHTWIFAMFVLVKEGLDSQAVTGN